MSDPRILGRIADALMATRADTVVEIGPGPGGLTAALVERAGRVIAIEKDATLIPSLRARVPAATIVAADALEADWHALAGVPPTAPSPTPGFLVAGNIPYNITSPLIEKALEPPLPMRIVFLVQQEVGERIAATPGSRAYGALSVGVQTVATVELLGRVPAGAFTPRPKVDSVLLRFAPLPDPLVADAARASFRKMVVGLFGFRRKQLRRALRELTGWPPERVAAVLNAAGVAGDVRPEALPPRSFVALHHVLVDGGSAGS